MAKVYFFISTPEDAAKKRTLKCKLPCKFWLSKQRQWKKRIIMYTWRHPKQVKVLPERKIGLSSARALAKASSPHGYQSTCTPDASVMSLTTWPTRRLTVINPIMHFCFQAAQNQGKEQNKKQKNLPADNHDTLSFSPQAEAETKHHGPKILEMISQRHM